MGKNLIALARHLHVAKLMPSFALKNQEAFQLLGLGKDVRISSTFYLPRVNTHSKPPRPLESL
jgi:hypothetical protein